MKLTILERPAPERPEPKAPTGTCCQDFSRFFLLVSPRLHVQKKRGQWGRKLTFFAF